LLGATAGGHDQHAQVLLGGEDGARVGGDLRGDDHLGELAGDGFGRRFVDGAVEGDDAAEGRGRVGLEGLSVGLQRRRRDGDAAGVGVLDDDAGRHVVSKALTHSQAASASAMLL
jgi:hypothetical protein